MPTINQSIRCLLVAGLMLLVACQQIPSDKTSSQTGETPLASVQPAVCDCPIPISPILREVSPKLCLAAPVLQVTAKQPKVEQPKAKKPMAKKPKAKQQVINELLVIGQVERVLILPDGLSFKARIDTGAGISSLHAIDLTEFDRDGKPWVRFSIVLKEGGPVLVERAVKRVVEIKQLNGPSQRRPVVAMSIKLGPIEEQVEMTLTDRTDYLYQVLIGRNFLRDRAIVDVSRRFSIKSRAKALVKVSIR